MLEVLIGSPCSVWLREQLQQRTAPLSFDSVPLLCCPLPHFCRDVVHGKGLLAEFTCVFVGLALSFQLLKPKGKQSVVSGSV